MYTCIGSSPGEKATLRSASAAACRIYLSIHMSINQSINLYMRIYIYIYI